MNKLILLLITSFFLFSFIEKGDIRKNYAQFEMNGKNIYIGKYEVSNGEYYNFLNDIKHNGKKLTIARVYSENWENELEHGGAFQDHYFGNEQYFNYPVVNITYEGAELYCAWLSEKMTNDLGVKVIVRLPTEEEWMYAAKGGKENTMYGWKGTDLSNINGDLNANFKTDDAETTTITTPVDAFQPNELGLYNCSGNVAEIIQTKNVSMGGSWTTLSEDIALNKSARDYNQANPYTGFRVVFEMK